MRAVLDTNVILSALLFTGGRLAWLRSAWETRRFVPLADAQVVRELLRVLAYPKFQLDPQEIQILLSGYLPYVHSVENPTPRAQVRCRDPKDQIFLDLAAGGEADVLVTGDRALLELDARVPFAIEKPASFRRRFE
ncbi:MAG: putative toxin-antitoxin system toxin component, PIN family [Deltaproteobacteria bacterium]|nr:putative toxin-antitoxin system toxin component, PIN family [Deltaproteobacteria bacterium]